MLNTTVVFFLIALFCYTVVSIYFVRALISAANLLSHKPNTMLTVTEQQPTKRRAIMVLLVIGMIFHSANLLGTMINDGQINFSVFNIISLTTLMMLGFSLLFSMYRPVIVLNILAAPIAAVGLIAQYIFEQPIGLAVQTTNFMHLSLSMELHIMLSIAAHSVLFMATVQAVLVSLQNRELKHKTITRVWVRLLPALQTMEKLLFDMIIVGFTMLTLALIFGGLGVENLLAQHLVHKTVFSLLAWLLFAVLIFGHFRFGWRGKLATRITLWGFAMLATGFIGTKFVLQVILG